MKNIEVCLSPELINQFALEQRVVVIVDILRATSCMVAAFSNEVAEIMPVATVEECIKLMNNGYLGAAEREGIKVEGFDLDNSPFTYLKSDIKGKKIAMTTTNGTQAIVKSAHASHVLIGAFNNITALAHRLIELNKDIVIVCAGWKGAPNIEDTLFAGALIEELASNFTFIHDGSILAHSLYINNKNNILHLIENCSHYRRLDSLNIKEDIIHCLTLDLYTVVPELVDSKLVLNPKSKQVLTA